MLRQQFIAPVVIVIGIVVITYIANYGTGSSLAGYASALAAAITGAAIVLVVSRTFIDYFSSAKPTPSGRTDSFALLPAQEIRKIVTEAVSKALASSTQGAPQVELEIHPEERSRILRSIEETARTVLVDRISERVLSTKDQRLSDVAQELDRMARGVEMERYALERRANLNLLIGIAVTFGAAGYLAYATHFATTVNLDRPWDQLPYFLPKLSLAIIIQVFAYFFLRLYRNSLSDLKYYRNEAANFQARAASLRGAIAIDDRELVTGLLRNLASTERNIVLKADEALMTMRRDQLEHDSDKNVMDFLRDLASRVRPEGGRQGGTTGGSG